MESPKQDWLDYLIHWIGSGHSIALHTVIFIVTLGLPLFHTISWSMAMLFLTTAVSLEAIYLAIFIQRAVNKTQKELGMVEEEISELHAEIVHENNPWREMPAETKKSIEM